MNNLDFLIVYFTCGAPFAVEYFLRRRTFTTLKICFLKSLLILLFWLPYSLYVLWKVSFKKNNILAKVFPVKSVNIFDEDKFEKIQKRIENISLFTNNKYSLFEFRDLFNRYKGLALENKLENESVSQAEKEIFSAANANNTEISAICLHRRNRARLLFHFERAQNDFLVFLNEIFQTEFNYDKTCLILLAFELSVLLNDFEMQAKLRENFPQILPNNSDLSADYKKAEVWKKDLRQKLQTSQN